MCYLIFSGNLYAQYGGCQSSDYLKEHFIGSVTLVLITENDEFDERFKRGMEKYWKHTEFRFVYRDELRQYEFNKEYSYIKPYNEKHPSSAGSGAFSMLGVFQGGMATSVNGNLLASILIDELNTEHQTVDSWYRAEHFPKILHEFIQLKLSNTLTLSCRGLKGELTDYYNSTTSGFTDKKLYVMDEYLSNRFNEGAIQKTYKGAIKVVSKEEISESIEEGIVGACYLVSISSYHKYTLIIDFETGGILYARYHTTGIGLNKRDINYINLNFST